MPNTTVGPEIAPPSNVGQPGIAILVAVVGTAVFAVQDAIMKLLTADYPILQVMGVRSVAMLLPAAIMLRLEGGWVRLKTRRPLRIGLRCLLQLLTMVTFYFALSRLPLGEVSAIVFAAPLIMTALSGPLLGERVGLHRWAAVVLGFVGVELIMQPGAETTDSAAVLAALTSSLGYALLMILTRHLSRSESPAAMLSYSTALFLTVGLASGFVQWVPVSGFDLALMASLGLLGGVSNYMMIQAYRLAPVATVAPFEYTHLVWAMTFGFLIWSEIPSLTMLAGAAVVVACGLYVVLSEKRMLRPAPSPGG